MSKKGREEPTGDPKRSGGERSEPERSEGSPVGRAPAGLPPRPSTPPDPEVLEKARRRQYSADYKVRVLQEADSLKDSGEIGALLRREGLYSSNLITWRRQREEGILSALSPKTRGRRARERNPLARRVAVLEGENRELRKRLKEAETIIEVQKKLSELLAVAQESAESKGNSS
jgi:transposase-like protein